MKIAFVLSSVCLLISACSTSEPVEPETDLPRFGGGYRFAGDLCQKTGENAYTNQYLDDSADLVSCPNGYSELAAFLVSNPAPQEVGTYQGYTLYSVPHA